MGFICKGTILFSSILVFLSTTTCAIYPGAEFENKNLKSATFISKIFEVGPGKVQLKLFLILNFQRVMLE
jgi:hypothetical protein